MEKKYPEWEYADYYRASGLIRTKPNDVLADDEKDAPPWLGAPPDMETYEWRGCRVLSKSI